MSKPPIELWSVSAPLEQMSGGHRNLVFKTMGLEDDLVFKSSRRSADAVEWLLKVHDLARESGFIVPQVRKSQRGRLIEEGWTCEEFVVGEAFSVEELPAILPEMSKFHALAAGIPQRPGFLSSQALIGLDAGGDVDFNAMPIDLVETCRHTWRELGDRHLTVVHGDLNTGNVLRCKDGRAALIDWDECRRDLSVFDLGQLMPVGVPEKRALLAWEIACSWLIEPDHAQKTTQRLQELRALR